MLRFEYSPLPAKTIGVDFGVKPVKIPETDCVVELFLFDCPGQGVFNKLEQVT